MQFKKGSTEQLSQVLFRLANGSGDDPSWFVCAMYWATDMERFISDPLEFNVEDVAWRSLRWIAPNCIGITASVWLAIGDFLRDFWIHGDRFASWWQENMIEVSQVATSIQV